MPRKLAFVPPAVKAVKVSLAVKVDELAILRQEIASLKRREAELEGLLKSKLSDEKDKRSIKGQTYQVEITRMTSTSFSAVKAKEFLTPAQVRKCTKKTQYLKINIRNRFEDDVTSDEIITDLADGV